MTELDNIDLTEQNDKKTPVSIKMTAETKNLFRDYVTGSGFTQEEALRDLLEKAAQADDHPKSKLYESLAEELEPHFKAIMVIMKTAYDATETAVQAEREKAAAVNQKVIAEKDAVLAQLEAVKAEQSAVAAAEKEALQAVADAKNDAAVLADMLKKAEERERDVRQSLDESQESAKTLRKSLETAQGQAATYMNAYNEGIERVKEKDAEIKSLEAAMDAKDREVMELQTDARLKALEMEHLKEDLARTTADLQTAKADCTAQKRMVENYFKELNCTREKLDAAREKLDAANENVKRLTKDLADTKAAISKPKSTTAKAIKKPE